MTAMGWIQLGPSSQVGLDKDSESLLTNSTGRKENRLLSYRSVDESFAVFDEVASFLGHQTGWVAISDVAGASPQELVRSAEVGMQAQKHALLSKPVLVRLRMAVPGSEPIDTDVVVRLGQKVELVVPVNGQEITYQIKVVIPPATLEQEAPSVEPFLGQLQLAAFFDDQSKLATRLSLGDGDQKLAGTIATQSGHYDLQVALARGGV